MATNSENTSMQDTSREARSQSVLADLEDVSGMSSPAGQDSAEDASVGGENGSSLSESAVDLGGKVSANDGGGDSISVEDVAPIAIDLVTAEATTVLPDDGGSAELRALSAARNAEAVGRQSASTAYIPTDPLFSSQWHLRNTAAGQFDLNIVDAWDDYTGQGVEVAVIDNAFERNHPDLAGNWDSAKDWDFENNDTDPSPAPFDGLNHGTAVAGIIGAVEGNSTGVVGAAFDSTLIGFRVHNFINTTYLNNLADAINNASGVLQTAGADRSADVVNISQGTQQPFFNNFFDLALNSAAIASVNTALDNAVISGRGGLGTIVVKSAGNTRSDPLNQDTNSSSWNANPHSISVAAVDRDGTLSSYSTHGASVLVSGFGSPSAGQVVTTDKVGGDGYAAGDYTFTFNGTSAAAPMVTGVVALMLEANPSLGWRDVQEILAFSSRHVGTAIGSGISGSEEYAWNFNGASEWNGGGLHFSNDYGFGLVDAKAAVRLAETWETQRTSSNDVTELEDLLNGSFTLSGSNSANNFTATPTSNLRIEHVEVDIRFLQWFDLGDLDITLTSPGGTVSHLIDNTGENDGTSAGGFGSGRWEFFSNEFWGEDATGSWTLTLRDIDSNTVSPIVINDIDVTFYGSPSSTDDRFIVTEEFSTYAGLFGHSTNFAGGSGVNTLNAAAVDSASTIDLLHNNGTIDGVAISNSNINRVFTGDGNDTITGDGLETFINSGRGNDQIFAGSGDQTIHGGDGADTIQGNGGNDLMYGEAGNDTFLYTNGQGAVFGEILYGGAGSDRLLVQGAGTFDFGAGSNGFDVVDVEEIEFFAETGVDKTVIISNKETDSASEFMNVLIDGNATSNSDDTVIVNADFTDNVDLSGWTFQDWNTLSNNNDLVIINGNANANTLTGTSQNDSIDGASGIDTLYGGDGNDTLDGGLFDDTAYGGAGNDTFIVKGADLADHVFGGSGTDTLDLSGYTNATFGFDVNLDTGQYDFIPTSFGPYTVSSVEIVRGSDRADILTGTFGTQTLFGNGGDDTFVSGASRFYDEVFGGAGTDTLDHSASNYSGDTFDFMLGLLTGTHINPASVVLSSIEIYQDGSGGNTIVSDGSGDSYYGNGGDDYMISEIGAETMDGGAGGNDTIDHSRFSGNYNFDMATGLTNYGSELYTNFETAIMGAGNDSVGGTSGADTIRGGQGSDVLNGLGGVDSIDGGGQGDTIRGGLGDDSILGGGGNDLIIVDAGDGLDNVDGGSGKDTLDYSGTNGVIVFDMSTNSFSYGGLVRTANRIEHFNDSSAAGTITGKGGKNIINGNAGNDVIDGKGGKDVLDGGNGFDTIVGGGGNDSITGGNGDDDLRGNNGADTISGGIGNDFIRGDAKSDALFGNNGNDDLRGGSGHDTIDGGANNDSVIGGAGNDVLMGGSSGQDWLIDGAGFDDMYGGTGADTFDVGVDAEKDEIFDYQDNFDHIRLLGFNFAALTITDTATAGRVRIDYGGDRLFVEDNGAGTLVAADFSNADFLFT